MPARVLAVGACLAPEARRDAEVAAREAVGGEDLAAVDRRQRHLAGAHEEEVVLLDLVDLVAIGREEPGLLHRLLPHEDGRHDRDEPFADERAGHPLHERELEQHRFAHQVGEAGAAHHDGLLALHPAHRLAERGVVERGWRGRVAHDAQDLTVVLTAVGHRRVGGVGHLQRERAQLGVEAGQVFLEALQLLLERARGGDLRRPFVGRSLADLLRRRVLPRAQLLDQREPLAARGVGGEHVVDQSGRDALAFDAGAVPGSSRNRLRSITADHVSSRICARSFVIQPSASRYAFAVDALRRVLLVVPATGYEPEELHLRLLGRGGCAGSRRRSRRRGDPRSR